MSDFKTLQVWQRAHALSLNVDRACRAIRLPMYASMRNQLFRAAMSISANIAEGSGQRSRKEFSRRPHRAELLLGGRASFDCRARSENDPRINVRLINKPNDNRPQNSLRPRQDALKHQIELKAPQRRATHNRELQPGTGSPSFAFPVLLVAASAPVTPDNA